MPIISARGAASALALGWANNTIRTDPYFSYVNMLIPGNGTNAGQNNTFLDSSTNNFTITRSGNTTQGTISPYGPNWSNFFDGNGDFLTIPYNAVLDMPGDFTVEAWVYRTAASLYEAIGGRWGTQNIWLLNIGGTGTQVWWQRNGISTFQANFSFSLNTWYHIAVARSGTTTTIYVNGTSIGSLAGDTYNYTNATRTLLIGRNGGSTDGTQDWEGHISNFRIVNGTALYTGNFTPPSTPLTAVTNTAVLTCQSNRFVDTSANAFSITASGTPNVQRFSPFDPPAAYAASTIGASGYFDGTGDYLTVANDNVFDTNATFTLECWFYQPASGNATFFGRGGGASSWSTTNGHQFLLFIETNVLYWMWNNAGVNTQIQTTAPTAGQWHHLAVGYNGTTTRFWLDGASLGTSTTGYTLPTTRNIIRAGLNPAALNPLNGYLADLRFVKGTDVYGVGNATITVPTAPLTAITNTALLMSMTNASIIDNAMMNNPETVGNAQISTAQSKFGGSSIAFDGIGDWLLFANNSSQQLGSGDFTIEGWFYLNNTGNARGIVSKGTSTTGWSVNVTTGSKLQFSYTATSLVGAATLSANTWYYFAVVRSGSASGNLKIYLDGVLDATSAGAVTDNFNQTSVMYIGADRVGTSAMNGYVDDIRITRGYARTITAAPTTAFPTW